jgi:hypothetical protein
MTFPARLCLSLLGLLLAAGFVLGLQLAGRPAEPAYADAAGMDRLPVGEVPLVDVTVGVTGTQPLEETDPSPDDAETTYVYLPMILRPDPAACPTSSVASFGLIPIDGPRADHPDALHGDLNLGLRSYTPTVAFPGLIDDSDSPDPDAPYLAALFEPPHFPGIRTVYQVYDWKWTGCGTDGCRGELITDPAVTLVDLITTPGEPIYVPERSANIFGSYIALVLYAEERRITVGYTRRDSVAFGYAVHLENVCVDPNLLALYRAQVDDAGWRVTGRLPGLRHREVLGYAGGAEIQVAIRDRGTFLDPRSRKDWW